MLPKREENAASQFVHSPGEESSTLGMGVGSVCREFPASRFVIGARPKHNATVESMRKTVGNNVISDEP